MGESSTAARLPLRGEPPSKGYQPLTGTYDEMSAAPAAVRPQWRYLMEAIDALGTQELGARRAEVHRLLRENGVTYNVYGDPQSTPRLWPLDPLPVLYTSTEWSAIEQGLIQRAEVLDLALADIYGPRRLLRRGLIPPELVYAHPGFLRACAGVPSLGRHGLPVYAADLARGSDGVVRVIADRSQAPAGAGYAVENRTVLSRVFPSLYRDSHVHRLALFFRALRGTLASMDPRRQDNPRIVLLTPGPENEAYFEHAFLADYLGYTLVQGTDLTVRDGRVYLMALDGLKPVDVILRRVDDGYCDPLELRPDSLLGTPGLLQAARMGAVAIANPLGSSVLENPGVMAFLPGLARELLGEDLKIPSVATWWCGDPRARAYVIDHLDQLVVKPIHPHPSAATVFGCRLDAAGRAALAATIRARPHHFVGQEHLTLSTAPVVGAAGLEPRPLVLRAFLAAQDIGFVVMPGGLVRVSPGPDAWIVSNQHGGVSKDLWVLASEPERQVSLLVRHEEPVPVTRDGDDVPGRVADDLFWLGRYTERTEGAARLLREVVSRCVGSERPLDDEALPILLRAVTRQTATFPGFVGTGAEKRLHDPEQELLSVLQDRRRPGSLRYNLDAVVRTGRAVRDRLSSDASRVVNAVNREVLRLPDLNAARDALQRLIIDLAAFAGLCDESMSRGQGWRFLEVGRTLERAVTTSVLLRALFVPTAPGGTMALEALLAVAHSWKTYRRRYRSRIEPAAVLDLLLLDEANPRALAHQLAELDRLLAGLTSAEAPRRSPAQRVALDVLTRVRLFDIAALRSPEGDALATDGLTRLDALLADVLGLLAGLSSELASSYFTGAEQAPQQLVRIA